LGAGLLAGLAAILPALESLGNRARIGRHGLRPLRD